MRSWLVLIGVILAVGNAYGQFQDVRPYALPKDILRPKEVYVIDEGKLPGKPSVCYIDEYQRYDSSGKLVSLFQNDRGVGIQITHLRIGSDSIVRFGAKIETKIYTPCGKLPGRFVLDTIFWDKAQRNYLREDGGSRQITLRDYWPNGKPKRDRNYTNVDNDLIDSTNYERYGLSPTLIISHYDTNGHLIIDSTFNCGQNGPKLRRAFTYGRGLDWKNEYYYDDGRLRLSKAGDSCAISPDGSIRTCYNRNRMLRKRQVMKGSLNEYTKQTWEFIDGYTWLYEFEKHYDSAKFAITYYHERRYYIKHQSSTLVARSHVDHQLISWDSDLHEITDTYRKQVEDTSSKYCWYEINLNTSKVFYKGLRRLDSLKDPKAKDLPDEVLLKEYSTPYKRSFINPDTCLYIHSVLQKSWSDSDKPGMVRFGRFLNDKIIECGYTRKTPSIQVLRRIDLTDSLPRLMRYDSLTLNKKGILRYHFITVDESGYKRYTQESSRKGNILRGRFSSAESESEFRVKYTVKRNNEYTLKKTTRLYTRGPQIGDSISSALYFTTWPNKGK